jgi:uncharacterized RDD family membrane protein YckC
MSDFSSGHAPYASPWKRLAAFLVDLPVLGIVAAISRTLLTQLEGVEFVLCWIYYAAMESSTIQATLGKKLLGLKVADVQGNRAGFLRASGRYWGKAISIVSLGAGFAMVFFTREKQAFHDYVAGCVVLDERVFPQESSPDTRSAS